MPLPPPVLASTWSSSVLQFTTATRTAIACIRYLHNGFFAVFSQLCWTLLLLAFQPACTSFSASTLASVLLSVWFFTSASQYIVQRFCHHVCKRVLTFSLACLPGNVSSPLSNCQFSRWICRPTSLSKLKPVCYQIRRTSSLLACHPVCRPALLVSTSANVLQGY